MSKYDFEWSDIEQRMSGNWEAALMSIVNIDRKIFSGKHQSCPHCSGKDRFRWDNNLETKGDGGAYCNQCGAGSGMTWLMKLSGMEFKDAVGALAGFLNMTPREKLEAVRKEMPRIGVVGDLSPERVAQVMAKGRDAERNAWQLRNGIGCDLKVINGKSGELVAVPVHIPKSVTTAGEEFSGTACNVAMIADDGRVSYLGGYNKDSAIYGRVSRGGVTPIGTPGKFIYLVADYADAWRAHYLTNACVWCCWSPENMWEVVRLFDDRSRLRCIINRDFDEICAAENADLPIMLPEGADRIAGCRGIERKVYSAAELLDNKNPS